MDSLYKRAVKSTEDNRETKINNDKLYREEYRKRVNDSVSELYKMVINSNYMEKVDENSMKGLNRVTIFSVSSDMKINDYPLLFLMKGPIRRNNYNVSGLDFFKSMNIVPVIDLLVEYFSPFDVYFYYNKRNNEYCFDLNWGNKD